MPRSGPTSLTLPPFAGATRRLVLLNLVVFFALAFLSLLWHPGSSLLFLNLILTPVFVTHGHLWQLVTYAFINIGLLGTLFAMLTLWFTGSMLEAAYGPRWLYEMYFTAIVGGALLATAISYTHVFGLTPELSASGPYAGIFGLLIAIGAFFGDQEFLFFFVLRIKARYLVAIYILIEIAILLKSAGAFDALVQLSGGLCGYLFIRLAPRRGLAAGLSERYFALRNQFYRAKRRRAARKFEVYMRGQNREVHFDKDGRYVDPDMSDPNDKRWMN